MTIHTLDDAKALLGSMRESTKTLRTSKNLAGDTEKLVASLEKDFQTLDRILEKIQYGGVPTLAQENQPADIIV